MRYTYLGNKWTRDDLRGLQCDPVKLNGKCVICAANASALVQDADGNRYVVARRRLRLNEKISQMRLFDE